MKTKVLFAAVAVVFSFAVTSCCNKKAADAVSTEANSCCAAQTEQVCDSVNACCQAASAVCPKSNCSQTNCPKTACDSAKCNKPCQKK
ncbi:hypothetical protein [uncultured Bacteroides sp.]|uniref:hypothetical protein n=1 Tax=uncultured Bacteroides sp. TaxID=162156 RepID=UPI0025DA388F|nr:hypothetical protein [uncultured Bacteroides sp.]